MMPLISSTVAHTEAIAAENILHLFPISSNPPAAAAGQGSEPGDYDEKQVHLVYEFCVGFCEDDKPIGSAFKKNLRAYRQ